MAIFVGIVVVLAIAAVLFVRTRPDQFRVERSAHIGAPREVVFGLINDFRQWTRWSPWERLDPATQRTYSGSDTGAGAIYAWDGKKAGAGRMTIVESSPADHVALRLEFFRPFPGTNSSAFRLVPAADGTRVSWVMEGQNTLMGKLISAFFSMDSFLGKNFEDGLAALDVAAKAEATKRA